jgi:hypothetical protein
MDCRGGWELEGRTGEGAVSKTASCELRADLIR